MLKPSDLHALTPLGKGPGTRVWKGLDANYAPKTEMGLFLGQKKSLQIPWARFTKSKLLYRGLGIQLKYRDPKTGRFNPAQPGQE